MNQRDAMKMALEALEYAQSLDIPHFEEHVNALAALRDALAEPEHEPVAYVVEYENGEKEVRFQPNGWGDKVTPLYTHPPQRKPLTDEEIWKIYDETPSGKARPFIIRFVRSVLAAHGIGGEA